MITSSAAIRPLLLTFQSSQGAAPCTPPRNGSSICRSNGTLPGTRAGSDCFSQSLGSPRQAFPELRLPTSQTPCHPSQALLGRTRPPRPWHKDCLVLQTQEWTLWVIRYVLSFFWPPCDTWRDQIGAAVETSTAAAAMLGPFTHCAGPGWNPSPGAAETLPILSHYSRDWSRGQKTKLQMCVLSLGQEGLECSLPAHTSVLGRR